MQPPLQTVAVEPVCVERRGKLKLICRLTRRLSTSSCAATELASASAMMPQIKALYGTIQRLRMSSGTTV